jgi:hypothetical protein
MSEMSDVTSERYAALQAKLERDFPGINDPSDERYYIARLSGRETKALIEIERRRVEDEFASQLRRRERDRDL